MALFWRIWAAVALVNLTVVVLFVALATLQFGNISTSLAGERLKVLAARTAAPFEQALRLGLPLSTVRNAGGLIERARQSDDAILAVHVFERDGRIVFSTAEQPPPSLPGPAVSARKAARGDPWFIETAELILCGTEIIARDGRSAGGILIEFPVSNSSTRVWAMLAELGLAALGVLLLASVLAAGVLRVGLARQIAHFGEVDRSIDDFERAEWRRAAGAAAVAAERDGSLRSRLEDAEARYQSTGRALQDGP